MTIHEFSEIGHSGGKFTIRVATNERGQRSYQLQWTHNRPGPASIFAVYAVREGYAVADIRLGGMGDPWNQPPVPGCIPVFIGSDSQGQFGHQCNRCDGYWRSSGSGRICPYCATTGDRYVFLTEAQCRYVSDVCEAFNSALVGPDGDTVIDMDAVADAVGKNIQKPPFYYAEESQQKRFSCSACGQFNDILGRFCYCSTCGTRNDLYELESDTLARIRKEINEVGAYGRRAAEAVGAFDIFVRQYARQIVQRVPMRSARKSRMEKMTFHNLANVAAELKGLCDIDPCEGLNASDVAFATTMFHRRHVYEHNGGVVDEKYLSDSGDTTVRVNQEIRETQESAHRIVGIVGRMARSVHEGFHDIFPPEKEPIRRHADQKARMATHSAQFLPRPTARPVLVGSSLPNSSRVSD